jgi:hypothetical protein
MHSASKARRRLWTRDSHLRGLRLDIRLLWKRSMITLLPRIRLVRGFSLGEWFLHLPPRTYPPLCFQNIMAIIDI